jgi:hypothetical protein
VHDGRLRPLRLRLLRPCVLDRPRLRRLVPVRGQRRPLQQGAAHHERCARDLRLAGRACPEVQPPGTGLRRRARQRRSRRALRVRRPGAGLSSLRRPAGSATGARSPAPSAGCRAPASPWPSTRRWSAGAAPHPARPAGAATAGRRARWHSRRRARCARPRAADHGREIRAGDAR